MSGALARNWDYSYDGYDEEEDLEAEHYPQMVLLPQAEEVFEEDYYEEEGLIQPEAYQLETLYTVPFQRPRYAEQTPEASYHYHYHYQDTLRPRRNSRFTPLESLLGLLVLIPGRVLLPIAIGFVVMWLVISNGLPFLSKGLDSAKNIYAFGGSAPASANSTPASGNSVLGSPSISPDKINTVLRQYNSPAAGIGQAMYDLGNRYGIDPAYALAFFIHESSAGTQGVAAITKSIGNIRCTAGYDCYQTNGNGSFRKYSSWEAGAEDWFKLIKEQYIGKWGLKTLEQIIPVYAPSADSNNPASYMKQVAQMVNGWRNGK